MKKGMIILIIMGVVIFLLGSMGVSSYNSMVSKEEGVNSKLSDISVQLERRMDLIPNLVNSVKGYMKHEQSVIDSVTNARAELAGAKTLEEKANANDKLSTALNNLYVIVENYPDLKANTNFIQLQDELAGTENRISVARRDYNQSVEDYNTYIKKFPNSILAGMFNFEQKEYFKAKAGAEEVPNVSFE